MSSEKRNETLDGEYQIAHVPYVRAAGPAPAKKNFWRAVRIRLDWLGTTIDVLS